MKKAPSSHLTPEAEEIRTGLVGAMPEITGRLGSLLGRKLPQPSARDRAGLAKKVDRLMDLTLPHLKTLEELKDKSSVDRERLAAIDQLLTGFLKTAGQKLKLGTDPWDVLLERLAEQAVPPSSKWTADPTYLAVHQGVWDFLVHLYTHATPAQLSKAIDEWTGSEDALRYIHSVRLIDAASKRFRTKSPKRATDRLLLDLQHEYTLSASLFEARLKVFVFLAETVDGRPRPWAAWRNENLHNVLGIAARHKTLDSVVNNIDRNVRNALVHGSPVIDVVTGTCRFEDLKGSVAWTWREFFDQTRRLTVTVMAMIRFDSLQQFIHTQAMVRYLQCVRQSIPA